MYLVPYHDGVPVASAVSLSSPAAVRCRCRCSCSPDCCLVYLRCQCRTDLFDRVLTVTSAHRRRHSCHRCRLAANNTVIATSRTSRSPPASDYFPLATDYRCTRALLGTCLRLLTHLFRLGVGRFVLFLLLLFWRVSVTAAQYHTQSPSSPIGLSMRTRLPGPDGIDHGKGRVPSTHTYRHGQFDSQSDCREHSRSEHHLTPDLIQFVCTKLPNPCDRAAYLRVYARHSLCSKLPILFLLPLDSDKDETGKCGDLTWRPPALAIELQRQPWDSLYLPYLQPTDKCVQRLTELLQNITQLIVPNFDIFDDLVKKSYCKEGCSGDGEIVTGEFKCQECEVAYTDWLCASHLRVHLPFPLGRWQAEIGVNATSTATEATAPQHAISPSTNSGLSSLPTTTTTTPIAFTATVSRKRTRRRSVDLYRLLVVRQCSNWCTKVEKVCPYFNAVDDTSNGGEPAFLCHESHYHHSSLYNRQLYETGQCDDSCCYTDLDLRLLTSTDRGTPVLPTCRNLTSRCSANLRPRGSSQVGSAGAEGSAESSPGVSNSASSSGLSVLSSWLLSATLVWLVMSVCEEALESRRETRAHPGLRPPAAGQRPLPPGQCRVPMAVGAELAFSAPVESSV